MKSLNAFIYQDDDGLYCIDMQQVEIILLYAGVIPYIAFETEPVIPDHELLFVRHVPAPEDKYPELDLIPCDVVSIVKFRDDFYVLTLIPDEIDLDLELAVSDLKARLPKMPPLRTSVVAPPDEVLN